MADKSTWVEFRDSVIETLNFDKVTEDMKAEFARWLLTILLPAAKKAGASFVEQTKEQAKDESGWCKIRDLMVLPFIVEGGLWLIEKALTKTTD